MTNAADRFVRGVSVASSIGLGLMLVATVAYIAWPALARELGVKPSTAAAPPAYAAGEQVDVPAAWYDGQPQTLVLFARASCAACEKAQPFLQTLVSRMADRGGAVMAHPPGAPDDDRQFAESLGITADHVFSTAAGMRVRATPTVLLVDQQGRILHAWEGVGKEDRQAQILKALDAAR